MTAEPEYGFIRVTGPTFLLLGTDGLFDAVEQSVIKEACVSADTAEALAERLKKSVEMAPPCDNYTFIAFSLCS